MRRLLLLLLLSLLIVCQANDENDELSQITLMSYNVMLVPSILVFQRDQITRAHLLTKAKFLRTSDILCLQEVFQPKPSRILLDALADTYPYSTPILGNKEDSDQWDDTWNRHIGSGSLKFVSGGVTILSKWPIIYAGQYFYRHSCSAHTFVRTGFVYARILYGKNEQLVHVIGTHLQPNDHRGCYLAGEHRIRERQMNELRSFIDTQNIPKDELVFVLGDFNIDKYNTDQYESMIDILNVHRQDLHPSSIRCSWDTLYNTMTNSKHNENQLLDYILLLKDHTSVNQNWHWYNLITDRMASKQWHLLGIDRLFYNTRNLPLMELSDHYPIVGFFNLSKQQWPEKPSGVMTYVQFVTADTNLPVIIIDRDVQIGTSTNQTGSLFVLSNNGTPRRHRCLRSEQYIILIDAQRPEFYLSDAKFFRMKYGMEQVNRYLKIIQIDTQSNCIQTNSTIIFQTRQSTGNYYINNSSSSQLCACTQYQENAQQFRLIEIQRRNISCPITH